MNYLASDQAKKYILLNFSLICRISKKLVTFHRFIDMDLVNRPIFFVSQTSTILNQIKTYLGYLVQFLVMQNPDLIEYNNLDLNGMKRDVITFELPERFRSLLYKDNKYLGRTEDVPDTKDTEDVFNNKQSNHGNRCNDISSAISWIHQQLVSVKFRHFFFSK